MSLYFEFNPDTGRSEVVEPFVKSKPAMKQIFAVPSDAKVTCQRMDACCSPSKRRKGWVCGSSFSHNERMERCVAYRRLHYGLHDGVGGNRRFQK